MEPTLPNGTPSRAIVAAFAVAALVAPAVGFALSCAEPVQVAELTKPSDPDFEDVTVEIRPNYGDGVRLTLFDDDGNYGDLWFEAAQ